MTRAFAPTSALRIMIDERFSLSSEFGAVRNRPELGTSERFGSGQSKVGQVSAVGLRPITLEEKLIQLMKMKDKGEITFAEGVTLETLKHEMKKPENDGLSAKELVPVLAEKKMLKLKSPVIAFKPKAAALAPSR